jgi:adenylate cyclase
LADIFVSYARADKPRVAPFIAALERQGWSVWWDPEIAPGQEFDTLIASELKQAQAVVVVWTPASVQSRWVRGEARVGADRNALVPVRLDNAELPIDARAIHTIELDGWGEDSRSPAFQQVCRAISGLLEGRAAAEPVQSARSQGRTGISICVLPFANMSGDPEQEYFSDGISEDVMTDLGKVSALSVVARNTAFNFKGKSYEISQIARQLGVGHVLEGSVRKSGNRVRITAQLIDGAAGDQIWAERYDRDLDDIFALQDEISQAIVGALKLKLLPEAKKAIVRRGTESVEAYNIYLMARQEYVSGRFGARPYEAMIRLCQRAVEIDPDYAQAWALMALGRAYQQFAGAQDEEHPRQAAERALALNEGLAEAHAAMAWVLITEDRNDEAAAEAQLALRLDPDAHEANEATALTAFRQGRFEEAARYWERASELNDQDAASPGMLITCYTALGREADARRAAGIQFSRVEKVLAHDRNNGRALGQGALALAALGRQDRARDLMDRALLINPDDVNMRYNFACALSGSDGNAALDMLAPAFKKISAGLLSHAKIDPDLDAIRDHSRFKAMVKEAEARLG